MVEVVEDLLRGLVKGLIENFRFEELSGDFLHQLDAEGVVGADAIYLLQLFSRGFQDSPQRLESLDGFFGLALAVPARGAQAQQQLHDFIVVEASQPRLEELLPQPLPVPWCVSPEGFSDFSMRTATFAHILALSGKVSRLPVIRCLSPEASLRQPARPALVKLGAVIGVYGISEPEIGNLVVIDYAQIVLHPARGSL